MYGFKVAQAKRLIAGFRSGIVLDGRVARVQACQALGGDAAHLQAHDQCDTGPLPPALPRDRRNPPLIQASSLQLERPVLPDQVVPEAVMRLFLDELESRALINAPG